MKRIAVLVALLLGVCLASAPSASADYWRKCGDQHKMGAMWFDVKAHDIRCGKARAVADKYFWGGDKTPFRFRCQERQIGDEVWVVRCRRDEGRVQKVQFKYGA